MEKFDASHILLPMDAQFVVIDGGNHGQFGDYGFQPGDKQASITRTDQQSQVVDTTVKFLSAMGK